MCNLCINSWGQPLYFVRGYFYQYGGTEGRDSVGTTVCMKSPSTLFDWEAPIRPSLVTDHVDYDAM